MEETIVSERENLTEEQFLTELNKYPIVRTPDWQSWLDVEKKVSKTTNNKTKEEKITQNKNTDTWSLEPQRDFWKNLRNYLNNFFSLDEVDLIVSNLLREHYALIGSLSLHDIERIALELEKVKNS
eukprot:TRINITY_DN5764_c0_g2_i1.p1 TRINITY_DN5764_c0_g2~~TRINITY_DN5764_c0_g2_i1.p1  ORF type:complete len:126 (-),score=23.06 TRINITY_DN5764_c0_g2_i1:75-452(-)